MKAFFLLFACFLPLLAPCEEKPLDLSIPILVLNEMNIPGKLPGHFRTTNDPFRIISKPYPSRAGLEDVHASGSEQFSEDGLKALIQALKQPLLTIVDLRQEAHGFLNGMAVAWYTYKNQMNKGKTLEAIELDEKKRLSELQVGMKITLYEVIKEKHQGKQISLKKIPVVVKSTSTESALCNSFQVGYFRIPVTDNFYPLPHDIDRFIQFIQNLPEGTWLHFHCKAGKGRTTTFLCLYDMMRNAKTVSFEDIIKRQWMLGGINLQFSPLPFKEERYLLLKKFYEYCKSQSETFKQSWSEYNATH